MDGHNEYFIQTVPNLEGKMVLLYSHSQWKKLKRSPYKEMLTFLKASFKIYTFKNINYIQ